MIVLIVLYWMAFRLVCQMIRKGLMALKPTEVSIAPDDIADAVPPRRQVDMQKDYARKLVESQTFIEKVPRQICVRLN